VPSIENKPVAGTDKPIVISIVGRSGAGKTTLLEKLVSWFSGRGLRVGTIKHSSHSSAGFDQAGKDTWRHGQAGSRHVVLVNSKSFFSRRLLEKEPSLQQVLDNMPDLDLVFVEGWADQGINLVEVVSRRTGLEPVNPEEKLVAVISDEPIKSLKSTMFFRNDINALAEFLQTKLKF